MSLQVEESITLFNLSETARTSSYLLDKARCYLNARLQYIKGKVTKCTVRLRPAMRLGCMAYHKAWGHGVLQGFDARLK